MSEALFPLAFVLVAVAPNVFTKSIRFILYPLPNVAVTFQTLPEAMTFLLTLDPLSVVHLAAGPHVFALTLYLSVVVLALVYVIIAKPLVAETVALVVGPLTLVHALGCIRDDTLSITLRVDDLAAVDRVLVALHCEVGRHLQLVPIEQVGPQHLVVQVLLLLLVVEYEASRSLFHRHVSALALTRHICVLVLPSSIIRARHFTAVIDVVQVLATVQRASWLFLHHCTLSLPCQLGVILAAVLRVESGVHAQLPIILEARVHIL